MTSTINDESSGNFRIYCTFTHKMRHILYLHRYIMKCLIPLSINCGNAFKEIVIWATIRVPHNDKGDSWCFTSHSTISVILGNILSIDCR